MLLEDFSGQVSRPGLEDAGGADLAGLSAVKAHRNEMFRAAEAMLLDENGAAFTYLRRKHYRQHSGARPAQPRRALSGQAWRELGHACGGRALPRRKREHV